MITIATASTPGPEVYFQRAFGEWVDIAIHAFMLRSADGSILVDTGFGGPVDALNEKMRARKGAGAGFDLAIEDIWSRIGCVPDLVALTSFGPYAVGGLVGLPAQASMVASARGLADLDAPEEPALVHPLCAPVRDTLLSRARPVHGEAELAPGVVFHEVGVHHPASAAIEVATADGWLVIADPVFTARNLTDWVALGAADRFFALSFHRSPPNGTRWCGG